MATGLPLITYGLAEVGTTGSFTAFKVVAPLLAGVALVSTFAVYALRIKRPLLNLRLYRPPDVLVGLDRHVLPRRARCSAA